MNSVKFNPDNIQPHKNYPGEKEIHRKCGFRISYFQTSASYGPLYDMKPRSFEYYSLCHLTEGQGWYWSPGEEIRYFSAGEGVIIAPGFIHSYGGYKSNYIEDYICFNGPVADFLFNSGVIKNGIVKIGKVKRLLPIIKAALNLSDSGQIVANSLMQNLLVELYKENMDHHSTTVPDNIEKLLIELNRSVEQWWTIPEMANYCNVSENYFRRLFKERTGMSPKRYSESLKVQLASEKLLRSDDNLDLIASQLGYVDRSHFSKVFKRAIGVSPNIYRKQRKLNL